MSQPVQQRVVKLGGSLLQWRLWPTALTSWLGSQPAAVTVLIVGGGAAVDEIRQRQRREKTSDEEAHWQALEAMRSNARLVAQTVDRAILVATLEECRSDQANYVLDVQPMLRRSPELLPRHWGFTSDSIAAWVAGQWSADCELVLLKSCDRRGTAAEEWSKLNLVDACFVDYLRGLAVTWVNLPTHAV